MLHPQASEPLEVWCLVPTHRPDAHRNILANFRRQRYPNKRLLVVENGEARGAARPLTDKVLRSAIGVSRARSAGVCWLQMAHPEAYVVNMDDDDFYGPDYLGEHAQAARRGVVRGKPTGWVRFDDGLVFFGHTWQSDQQTAGFFCGGTIGSFVRDAGTYPNVKCGEEVGYLLERRRAGLETRCLSPLHYVYSRMGDPREHTFGVTRAWFLRYFGQRGVRSLVGVPEAWEGVPYGPAAHLD